MAVVRVSVLILSLPSGSRLSRSSNASHRCYTPCHFLRIVSRLSATAAAWFGVRCCSAGMRMRGAERTFQRSNMTHRLLRSYVVALRCYRLVGTLAEIVPNAAIIVKRFVRRRPKLPNAKTTSVAHNLSLGSGKA